MFGVARRSEDTYAHGREEDCRWCLVRYHLLEMEGVIHEIK